MSRRQDVLGVPITADSYEMIESRVVKWTSGDTCHILTTMSFPMLGPYVNNKEYQAAIQASDVVLPDGMAMIWLSRLLGSGIHRRLSGPDFFVRLAETASKLSFRYCLLGSTPEVLKRMHMRLKREYPGITVSGIISPPFGEWGPEEDNRLISRVNNSRAHMLWVGITAPRQEVWLHRQRQRLKVPVAAAIGAGFDFFAGTRKRAPGWMQDLGLEWLHRVGREPVRMLPRYLRSLPAVVKLARHHHRDPDSGRTNS